MATKKKTAEAANVTPEVIEAEPAQNEPVQSDLIQTGVIRAKQKVSTGNCADYPVAFEKPFDKGTTPAVVVGFLSGSTAARFGTCACAVVDGSVNNEGFVIRFYNGDVSGRLPGFSYIAFGKLTQ